MKSINHLLFTLFLLSTTTLIFGKGETNEGLHPTPISTSDYCCNGLTFTYTGLNFFKGGTCEAHAGQEASPCNSIARGCSNKQFTLTANGCLTSGISYTWTMGDGTTLTGQTIAYTYTAISTYTITLTISGPACGTTTRTILFTSEDCCCNDYSFNVVGTGAEGAAAAIHKQWCSGNLLVFTSKCPAKDDATYSWNFGDGSPMASGYSTTHTYASPGQYIVTLTITPPPYCEQVPVVQTGKLTVVECTPCTSCIGSFAPEPGEYVASVWVRETSPTDPNTFSDAELLISFSGTTNTVSITASSDSKIIDGWQRLEGNFTIPPGTAQLFIELKNNSSGANEVYFDDIRIHPFNSSMKTYVYDPITLRLVAELDERNYATFYEYDEDGTLIRVKKETEKGIMTIKETRQNNSK